MGENLNKYGMKPLTKRTILYMDWVISLHSFPGQW